MNISRLPTLTAADLEKALSRMGFRLAWQKGSHRVYRHPDGRRTTVPFHAGRDLPRKLVSNVIKYDLEMTYAEFAKFLKQYADAYPPSTSFLRPRSSSSQLSCILA